MAPTRFLSAEMMDEALEFGWDDGILWLRCRRGGRGRGWAYRDPWLLRGRWWHLPWGSESMTRTLKSLAAKEAARLMAVVVLPTPPF